MRNPFKQISSQTTCPNHFFVRGKNLTNVPFLCVVSFSLDSRNIDSYSPDNRKIVDWDVKLKNEQLKLTNI